MSKRRTNYQAKAKPDDKVNVLTLHELAAMKDVPATEPVPSFEQPVEYVFEIDGDAAPTVSAVATSKRSPARTRLVVRAKGTLAESGPIAVGEMISSQELSKSVARARAPRAFRPPWLDLVYLPRLVTIPEFEHFGHRNMMHIRVAEQTSREWPWICVGKVHITGPTVPPGSVNVGSGVMVGPNLMLTASHGMPWGTDNSTIKFTPAFRNGDDPRFGHAFVERWRGVRTAPNDPNGLDYVICKLNWRIGERTGWMGSFQTTNDDFYEDRRWISVGYPAAFAGGQRPAVEVNVRVEDVDNEGSDGREIETATFTSGGWSGGPLWGFIDNDPKVVAVNSGSEKDFLDPRRDVHAGGKHLVDLVKFGHANWA